jgi:hypothetical protein
LASQASGGSEDRQHRPVIQRQALTLDEQVVHRGPVLLDGVARDGLAPYGFGVDIRRALDRREAVLRGLGIDPGDSDRTARLGELERRGVGERVAARSGQTFVAEVGAKFRGRVQLSERSADGRLYAVVTDGARFVVLEASPDLKLCDGQTVVLTRDPRGRVQVRAHDMDREQEASAR